MDHLELLVQSESETEGLRDEVLSSSDEEGDEGGGWEGRRCVCVGCWVEFV